MYFSGPCKWAKVREPDDYQGDKKWKVDVYLNKDELKQLKASGLSLKIREDDDGKFVQFSRSVEKEIKGELIKFDPPKVLDKELNPIDSLVGNGSTVTAKIAVFDTAKGKGHRLEALRVDELIEFVPENQGEF
jgi:hypothetical protein